MRAYVRRTIPPSAENAGLSSRQPQDPDCRFSPAARTVEAGASAPDDPAIRSCHRWCRSLGWDRLANGPGRVAVRSPAASVDYAVASVPGPLGEPPDGVSVAAYRRRPATGANNSPTEAIATTHSATSVQMSDQATNPLTRPPREHLRCSATHTSAAMTTGTAIGIRTHRPLTPTSVEGAEASGVPNPDEEDVPYTGTRKAAPTSAAPHTNAPTVHQNARRPLPPASCSIGVSVLPAG
jgi:hypothetical protein